MNFVKGDLTMKTRNIMNFSMGLLPVLALLLTAGCVNLKPKADPTVFFVLNVPVVQEQETDPAGLPSVGVRSLRISDYFNRPEIIVRRGDYRITRQSDFRWAGDLVASLQSEFARWWENRQPERSVHFPPWVRMIQPDKELSWKVDRLEGQLNGDGQGHAVVALVWSWQAGKESEPRHFREEWSAPWDGENFDSLVQILGELLAKGFEEILATELQ